MNTSAPPAPTALWRRVPKTGWLVAALAGVAVALASMGAMVLRGERDTFAVLVPVYGIETVSTNGHRASLADLKMGNPGVPQVPMPVDVDNDKVPDILVALNLVNVQGAVNNPPQPDEVLTPNLRITRSPAAIALGKPSPALNVQVRLTVKDADPLDPLKSLGSDTILRFGYDTGPGGSIPQEFSAFLDGATTFFNPVTARVTANGYDGPLQLVGSVGDSKGLTNLNGNLNSYLKEAVEPSGDPGTTLRLAYRPFPRSVQITYRTDEAGQHIAYQHESRDEVDLQTDLGLRSKKGKDVDIVRASALVQRLPRVLNLDLSSADGQGTVAYESDGAHPGGRLPDVRLAVSSLSKNLDTGASSTLVADADVEALPAAMHGAWSFPKQGPIHALFEACKPAGPGVPCAGGPTGSIGAIDARVADFAESPALLVPYVPAEQQFLNVQAAAATDRPTERLVSGRVERIQRLQLDQDDARVEADIEIGDGEKPLELHATLDELRARGSFLDATSVISPLPEDVHVVVREAGDDGKTEPLTLVYEASESVDVDAKATVRREGAAVDAACGTRGTVCAGLKIRHIPTRIETRIGDFENRGGQNETRVGIDLIPRDGGTAPDVFADVTAGQDDGVPLLAHAEMLGVPKHMRIRAVEGLDETTERAEFHACDRDFDAQSCAPDSEKPVGALSFSLRNFTERPADLPPPYAATPMFASITGRGVRPGLVLYEAAGKVVDVAEVQYLNKGAFGLRTRVGDGTSALSSTVDLLNVDSDSDPVKVELVDLKGEASITPLPRQLDFCFREAGLDLPDQPFDPVTAPCEDGRPFGPTVTVQESPSSIAYVGEAGSTYQASAKLDLRRRGPTAAVEDDQVVQAGVDIHDVPSRLTAHVQTPEAADGPLRARYVTPLEGPQVDIDFSARLTDGDLTCLDPRTPAEGNQAMCVSGRVENLPNEALLLYDPAAPGENFVLDTSGRNRLDVKKLALSSVKSKKDKDGVLKPDVVVATADLLGLPEDVRGTVRLPGTVDFTATPPIGEVTAEVRNFIAPDPMPTAPGQRAGLPAPQQSFTAFQRGDLFKASATIKDVAGFGFARARDGSGNLLDTTKVRVDFGKNQVVRAYADLDFLTDPADPASQARIIGDVTLEQVPAGIGLCFRGKKQTPGVPATGTATFCDTQPKDDEGAFQLEGRPGADLSGLDVHGFVRFGRAGGTDVLAAKVDIDNVPFRVAGTFSEAGTVDVAGYDLSGQPDGIDRIAFDLANYDLLTHGYPGTTTPWGTSRPGLGDFPGALGDQYLRLAAIGSDFHVKGSIGAIEAASSPPAPRPPGSDLKRLFVSSDPCTAPASNPADYPALPDDTRAQHTCLKAEFEQVNGGAPDPLHLDATIDKGGKRIVVRDAGISDIPEKVQVNLARADTTDGPDQAFRVPCGPTSGPATDCMPPLLRVDTSEAFTLFGVFELGSAGQVSQLRKTVPVEGDTTFLDAPPSTWGPGVNGARAKVGVFDAGPAVQAAFRLPLGRSFTLDQMQTWDGFGPSPATDTAKDIKLHYAVRDANGLSVRDLGTVSAMIHFFGDGQQILLGGPEMGANGFKIPGELGLGLYLRKALTPVPGEEFKRDRMFLQVDGRSSTKLDIGARVFGGPDAAIGKIRAKVLDIPAAAAGDTNPENPSFRIRFETNGKKEPAGSPVLEALKCIVFCVVTGVDLESLTADLDLNPTNTAAGQARRLEGYLNDETPSIGFEVRGYDAVTGGNPKAVSANAKINLDPLNVFVHAGIPVLGSFDMTLLSRLQAEVNIDKADEFRVWNNLLHIRAEHRGPGDGSYVYAGLQPRFMLGILHSIFGIFIGNPVLYGFTWAWPPEVPPPALLTHLPCPFGPGGGGIDRTNVGAGGNASTFAYFSPLEPRYVTFGPLGTFDLLGRIVTPLFCLAPADLPLMASGHPAAPFSPAGHPVPDAPVAAPPATPAPAPPAKLEIGTGASQTLCGEHAYESAKIEGTLNVTCPEGVSVTVLDPPGGSSGSASVGNFELTGAIDARPSAGPVSVVARNISIGGAGRVHSGTGKLTLSALNHLQVDGQVSADGVQPGTVAGSPPAANGGGGHAGQGGAAFGGGAGGSPYGTPSAVPVDGVAPIEAGSTGATHAGGPAPGRGGGVMALSGNTVGIGAGGKLWARGRAGDPSTVGTCGFNTTTSSGTVYTPPAGTQKGAGGGSGGGIVLSGTVVTNSGAADAIEVSGGGGGSGKAGGGGGGSGGYVKTIAPVFTGNAPATAAGPGGGKGCPIEGGPGAAGAAGVHTPDRAPASQAGTPPTFWNRGPGLQVPFVGAASATAGNAGFHVVLCGLRRPPEAVRPPAGQNAADPNYGLDMVTSHSLQDPCGPAVGDTTVHRLGTSFVNADRQLTGSITVDPSSPITQASTGNGFWGLYTVVLKPGALGNGNPNSCTNPFDNGGFSGHAYDIADCTVERLASGPDAVIGVDNSPPTVTASLPARTSTHEVQLSVTNVTDDMAATGGPIVDQSGIRKVECSNDATTWKECAPGTVNWTIAGTVGPNTVHVRAFDLAGGTTTTTATIQLDAWPPVSVGSASPSAPPAGRNGWYPTSPTFTIRDFQDVFSLVGGVGPGNPRFQYWFDGGTAQDCNADPCTISDPVKLPGPGRHTFNWQAIDALGNRQPVQTIAFKVDGEKPKSVLLTAPAQADGANGWFATRPWLVPSAVDQPGASGLVRAASDLDPGAGVFLTVNGTDVAFPHRLTNGTHTVCRKARDVAGNLDQPPCQVLKVDDQQPSATIQPVHGPADGDNGWFKANPTATVAAADAHSGLAPTPVNDDARLCSARPAKPGEVAPSGTCVSVDGGPFRRYTAGFVVPEGIHDVRTFAVDVAGHRTPIQTRTYRVDLSDPVVSFRTRPRDPAAPPWFRSTPNVVLRAVDGDQNAGVRSIHAKLDAGAELVYGAPLTVPEGRHTVTFRAVDESGRQRAPQTVSVSSDLRPPTVAPVVPGGFLTGIAVNVDAVGVVTTGSTFNLLTTLLLPSLWSPVVTGPVELAWSGNEALGKQVRATVVVHDLLGTVVRRLPAEPAAVSSTGTYRGSVRWDGKRDPYVDGGTGSSSVDGALATLSPGLYYYRVVVVDEAGNWAQSGESKPLYVKIP